jgi:SAM-dependent methyltransferase
MASETKAKETWTSGEGYEPYIGRWSRLVAAEFLAWLDLPPNGRWLDVGCGTGALTQAILRSAHPRAVVGVDPSSEFLAFAHRACPDHNAAFVEESGESLSFRDDLFTAVVSGLALNFIPRPSLAISEMRRVTTPGGTVAAYVWDYTGKMELLRHFWDAAAAIDPEARALDEGTRFASCRPELLQELFASEGLRDVATLAIDVPTLFPDFDDFWTPFLEGQGPAPTYVASLTPARRDALRDRLRADAPFADDGSLRLIARAWAVRGKK